MQAAEAFWRDENANVEQGEAIATIAQRIKFRPKSVLSLSVAHCTESVGLLTGSHWALSGLLAVGIDAGMVVSELAELAFDSLLEDDVVLVRGGDQPRLLTFEGASVTIELVVMAQAAIRNVVGQLVPVQRAMVEVVHTGGVQSAHSDDLGRFEADALGPGPMRIRVVPESGRPVTETDWVAI